MAEHIPATPEQNPTAAENASASQSKSIKEILTSLLADNKDLNSTREEFKKEGYVKDEKERKKMRHMRDDLRVIINTIQTRGVASLDIPVPPVVSDILTRIVVDKTSGKSSKLIEQSEINNESAPIVYELLRISMPNSGYDFGTPDGMARVLSAMVDIAAFEPYMGQKIVKVLFEDAKMKGCTADNLEVADKFLNPLSYAKTDNELFVEHKKHEEEYKNTFAPIQFVALSQIAKDRIRLQIENSYGDRIVSGAVSSNDVETIIQREIDTQTENVRGEISLALSILVGSIGSHSETVETIKYNSVISGLRSKGLISEIDFHSMLGLPENNSFKEFISGQFRKREGADLVGEAMRVFVPSEQQVKLLRAISSATSLKAFLRSEVGDRGGLKYIVGDKDTGKVNWDEFTKDIKGIFGELLAIADRDPNQFFERAFNPMYEGHLYQILLQRVSHLGAQITASAEGGDDWFHLQKIVLQSEIVDPSPKTAEAPYKMLTYINESKYDFGTAVGEYLTNNMNDYKMVREHLHNISAICTQGLGWEQLKTYAERLDLDKMDRLMRQEEDLSLALNYYSDALQKEVASKGRIVTSDFGRSDPIWQLNSAERIAFFQIKANLKAKSKNKGLSEAALNRQAIQKVRMASAISYGITGEFWVTMLTARMPITGGKSINAVGEEVNGVTLPYIGTHHRGYEKMIGELDLDLVFQRFDIPKLYNSFRHVHSHRDMAHPPGAYSKEGYFAHGDAYDNRYDIEDATVHGRSDKLAHKDEFRVYLMDYLRTKCVGMFARGGWRFANWDTLKEYRDESHNQVDYVKTLANVRKMGSFMTRRFIDELKPADISGMNRDEIKAVFRIDRAGSQFTEKEIESLLSKETLYENLLFDQMSHVIPTKFLQLQERRWTPYGEKMLKDDLCDYLKSSVGSRYNYPDGIVSTHVYNMYVAALTLAEKSAWKERRLDDQNYTFGASDIDNHRVEIESFFESYKQSIGEHNESGRKILIHENIEEFMIILKGVSAQLRRSIDAPRHHNENNTGPQESLQKRFANMLNNKTGDSKGNIENLIGGDDFDAENFSFGAVGGFGVARFMGETFAITSKMNPALGKIFFEVLPEFTKSQFKDISEVKKFMHEKMLPPFKEIHGAISGMDKVQADEYCMRLALFVSNCIGKDRISRIKGIGSAIDWWKNQRDGTQSGLYQDTFPTSMQSPTHAADSDEIYAMAHTLMTGLNIPKKEELIDHMETRLSIFGLPIIQRNVYKKDKIHVTQELFEKSAGLTGATKWFETYIPIGAATIALILLAMAYFANKKNTKK